MVAGVGIQNQRIGIHRGRWTGCSLALLENLSSAQNEVFGQRRNLGQDSLKGRGVLVAQRMHAARAVAEKVDDALRAQGFG